MPARGTSAKLRRVVQQRVEQGALPVAAARMHHQADRLVDHQQGIVLVDDVERDVLGQMRLLGGVRLRHHFQFFAAPDFLSGRGKFAIHLDLLSCVIHSCRRLREYSGSSLARA